MNKIVVSMVWVVGFCFTGVVGPMQHELGDDVLLYVACIGALRKEANKYISLREMVKERKEIPLISPVSLNAAKHLNLSLQGSEEKRFVWSSDVAHKISLLFKRPLTSVFIYPEWTDIAYVIGVRNAKEEEKKKEFEGLVRQGAQTVNFCVPVELTYDEPCEE